MLPIIDIFTADDLSVHFHMSFIQLVNELQLVPRKPVMEQLTAQLRFRRLDRNIDWRKLLVYDTFNILILHIGQRYIIPL